MFMHIILLLDVYILMLFTEHHYHDKLTLNYRQLYLIEE